MLNLMQPRQLLMSRILRHAQRFHGDVEVVSYDKHGAASTLTYEEIHARSCQLANALKGVGTSAGARVATLAWNDHRHLEVYFAVAGMGAVCHTINPRLHLDDIDYIVNDAQDLVVFYDPDFSSLVAELRMRCRGVKHWVCFEHREGQVEDALYEELIDSNSSTFEWPEFSEDTACALCYTSGTTGRPKGVLTSHRSNLLMYMSMVSPDVFNVGARDVVLAVAPMFHVASWGFPFAAPMVGAKLVLPGPNMSGSSLFDAMEAHGVTMSTGVPTVWIGVIDEIAIRGRAPSRLKRALIGGSACSSQAIETLETLGIEVLHSWGMTELSPLGTLNQLKNGNQHMDVADRKSLKLKQGRPPFGVDLRIVDDNHREVPWGPSARGALEVQGHWAIESYFNSQQSALNSDGWLSTGDIANIDSEGYMQLVDREKDIIKSGGEWISSLELERAAQSCDGIQEVAAIGVPHQRWQERPVLIAVALNGVALDEKAVLHHVKQQVASWQVPDRVVQVSELPKTGTGKVDKKQLRTQFQDLLIPTDSEVTP
ncbi:long-chain fatty acid--CoA ligase [Variovorax ginsengisoli]|uniref:Fatty-acyl-CoA synthase n=1 Tax=Variovorax ginsengisoli TaxID=363844 RepID=A0ABT9SGD2_9BURK|nr:long-chain fatty acid--CoA ligase [Variovorax ginsengisoli]MDP9902866.1 fatty-acyl-CoA synthase [Variovorax ginsengisoli]